eukprot:5363897-Prymnesium_polylepis.2
MAFPAPRPRSIGSLDVAWVATHYSLGGVQLSQLELPDARVRPAAAAFVGGLAAALFGEGSGFSTDCIRLTRFLTDFSGWPRARGGGH